MKSLKNSVFRAVNIFAYKRFTHSQPSNCNDLLTICLFFLPGQVFGPYIWPKLTGLFFNWPNLRQAFVILSYMTWPETLCLSSVFVLARHIAGQSSLAEKNTLYLDKNVWARKTKVKNRPQVLLQEWVKTPHLKILRRRILVRFLERQSLWKTT